MEERILDLQEKKRELAKAAIEGGKAVGKLNMKDILQLFRRDAEHDTKHEDGVESLALGSGRSQGLLERAALGGTVSRSSPVKVVESTAGRAGGGGRREQPKFKVPPSLRAEWDANNPYGRRAGF